MPPEPQWKKALADVYAKVPKPDVETVFLTPKRSPLYEAYKNQLLYGEGKLDLPKITPNGGDITVEWIEEPARVTAAAAAENLPDYRTLKEGDKIFIHSADPTTPKNVRFFRVVKWVSLHAQGGAIDVHFDEDYE